MKKRINKGFTIVELLVVIVVIGILAAITIVSYTGISNKAKKTSALVNANSVQKIIEVYKAQLDKYPDQIATFDDGTIAKMPNGVSLLVYPDTLNATNGQNSIMWKFDGPMGAPTGGTIEYWDFETGAVSTNVIRIGTGIGQRQPFNVRLLVVGGGGNGASDMGGGGGAGGVVYNPAFPIKSTTYTATIGGSAQNTTFDTITAFAGGSGGSWGGGGGNGGSGGGGGGYSGGGSFPGGTSTQTSFGSSTGYGFGGGNGGLGGGATYLGAGGGGAGAAGTQPNGGVGRNYSSIFGTGVGASGWFGGGGGGGAYYCWAYNHGGAGGQGGGGNGADSYGGFPAAANTGGGGGGGSGGVCSGGGGAGGSGAVVIAWPTGMMTTVGGTAAGTVNGYDVKVITSSGTFTAS